MIKKSYKKSYGELTLENVFIGQAVNHIFSLQHYHIAKIDKEYGYVDIFSIDANEFITDCSLSVLNYSMRNDVDEKLLQIKVMFYKNA